MTPRRKDSGSNLALRILLHYVFPAYTVPNSRRKRHHLKSVLPHLEVILLGKQIDNVVACVVAVIVVMTVVVVSIMRVEGYTFKVLGLTTRNLPRRFRERSSVRHLLILEFPVA
jgi:hypothetical protein